ncbi:hypothetical protein QFZ35_001617 [Arthrobacter ulcerisalmonis]|nr:hypothetical protein [Arthrobacter ulcerisalmonis]MDQ0663119.1 hypothetical protein [Arthrobacter ulcerisalmonis]
MTARAVASLLRKAWLLTAILAVVAGLLGMHVLTSGHASHGAVSQGAAAVAHSPAGDHAVGDHAATGATDVSTDAPVVAPATCGDSCPGAQAPGAQCIPSAPGAPVTVSPPQATLAALPLLPTVSTPGPAYDYLPPSPTPCDLSISRT